MFFGNIRTFCMETIITRQRYTLPGMNDEKHQEINRSGA